jgi:hypothetical protein
MIVHTKSSVCLCFIHLTALHLTLLIADISDLGLKYCSDMPPRNGNEAQRAVISVSCSVTGHSLLPWNKPRFLLQVLSYNDSKSKNMVINTELTVCKTVY